MAKARLIYCTDCGQEFVTRGHNTLRCPECQKEYARKRNKEYMTRIRKGIYPGQPAKTIYEIERERHIYNKEHGTNLSYGQYVLKVEGVQTNGKKKR